MKKSEAIDLFDGKVTELAAALGVSWQAVSQWPEELSDRHAREILGAAILEFGVERVRVAFPKIPISFKTPA